VKVTRLAPALLLALTATAVAAQEDAAPPPEAPADQQQPLTFGAEVEQVIVDLVVTNDDGEPVPGISRDDLIVKEDGVPQEIVSFDAVQLPDKPAEEPPPPPRVSTNTHLEEERGRTFAIVFDDMNLTPFRARDAKAAVASFLKTGVREGDYVSLVATSGSAWWTARMESGRDKLIDTLKRLDGRRIPEASMERLTDWEAMRIHVYRDPQVTARVMRRFEKYGVSMLAQRDTTNPLSGTLSDPFVTARASDVYFQARTRNRIALETLERVLNGLSVARGRKSVILVSEGFIYDPNLDEFKRVNAAARRSNAAIYFVNARGLEGLPMEFSAEFGPALPSQDVGFALSSMDRVDDGSESLASDSGGFTVKNTNDLNKGIHRIAKETQIYYLLGYVPSNTARDGTFREIEVKFKKGAGKDLKIRARKGYYAPSPDGVVEMQAKAGVDPVIQAALDSPWAEDGIPLRMTHYVGDELMLGKARVLIVAEVDIRDLHFTEEEGRLVSAIEFLLVVAHRESGEFFRYDQTITMRLRPSTHERLSRVWFPIIREFELQPGDSQAKIIVREKSTGEIGSVVHEFQVPPLEEFRVATPILSDTFRKSPEGVPENPQPLARREFHSGEELLCKFEVFGAEKNETGMPEVAQGYEVRRADGTLLTSYPESVIQPTSIGHLSRLFGFRLTGATPGQYELVMTVEDKLSGKKKVVREEFEVVESPPEPADDGEDAAAGKSASAAAPAPSSSP
jgi:VWFA-related protein